MSTHARERLATLNAMRERTRQVANQNWQRLNPITQTYMKGIAIAMDRAPRRRARGVGPAVALQALYRARLLQLIREMQASVEHWMIAAYRQNEPAIASDALPAKALAGKASDLRKQWQSRFNEAAAGLAEWFAKKAWRRSEKQLQKILRDGGMSVKFTMTQGMKDVFAATVEENVSLIRSIPSKYFDQIEGLVQRSVATGRDLHTLSIELRQRYGVTAKRAALIARDQNNKATSALSHARQRELGIEEAIWMHSHAGKEPRPTHVKMDGKKYDLAKGMWDEDEGKYVFPGELINCRCTSRPVIPGF